MHYFWRVIQQTLHVVSAYINKNDTFPEVLNAKSPKRYALNELQSNVSSSTSIITPLEQNTSGNPQLNDALFLAGHSTTIFSKKFY